MGLMTKSIFETLTDKLVGRAIVAIETPAPNMLAANAEASLTHYLDGATTDPYLQAALLSPAAAVDRQVLRRNLADYLDDMFSPSAWDNLCRAMNTYVQSTNGGGYASLAAYVDDVSAKVHPFVAEIFRACIDEGCFSLSGAITGPMHPLMDTAAFDRFYTGAQGSLTDDTTDAGDTDTADVPFFAADNDVIVLGSRSRFNRILCDLSTLASSDCAVTAYYWNGTAWTALSITDLTTGFSVNDGMISFAVPPDWEPTCYDMQGTPEVFDTAEEGEYYYVIIQRTEDTVATPPVATWFRTCPEAVVTSSNKLYGVDQPPLALVRITDVNTCLVTAIQDAQYDRFECPGVANNELQLVAINLFSENITFTLGYTDQEGNAATKAQTAWTTPAAGGTKVLALDTGDTGVRAVSATTCAVTTTATSGIFAIVVQDYARSIAAK